MHLQLGEENTPCKVVCDRTREKSDPRGDWSFKAYLP